MTATYHDGSSPGRDGTRPSLLLRLRDPADDEAWRVFVDTYTPLVYGYCRRRGLQPNDVADVTQDVMTEVCRSIPEFSYRPERGRFRDWLATVTRSQLLKFLRRDQRAGKGTGGPDADDLIRQLAAPEADTLWDEAFRARVLEVALKRIRPEFEESTWRAFERTWIDGQDPARVSAEVGLSVGAVYVAKSRVLKRLREEVAALAEDYPLMLASGE
jgi:RNA polymerase sigma-70 factor (ECF subfamily)